MKSIEAVLLPAEDGAEPIPVSVNGLESLQGFVGGHIDAVQVDYNTDELPVKFDEYGACRVVGYLNDEGILLGLPLNKLATLVFGRPLFGPVVLVGGDDGEGNDTELPSWFLANIYSGALRATVEELDSSAKALAEAIRFCVADGAVPDEVARSIAYTLANGDPDEVAQAEQLMEGLLKYYISRKLGMERPDWEAIDADIAEEERLIDQFDPSDEEIYKWIQGGE